RPGPGQYDLGSAGFSGVKGCTIGEKINKKLDGNLAPGPGAYDPNPRRPQSGAKIGKERRNGLGGSIGPGPGAYEMGYGGKSVTEVKMGTSQRKDYSRA
ncbi:unnamed protein product, partial [Sphagnum balticum]